MTVLLLHLILRCPQTPTVGRLLRLLLLLLLGRLQSGSKQAGCPKLCGISYRSSCCVANHHCPNHTFCKGGCSLSSTCVNCWGEASATEILERDASIMMMPSPVLHRKLHNLQQLLSTTCAQLCRRAAAAGSGRRRLQQQHHQRSLSERKSGSTASFSQQFLAAAAPAVAEASLLAAAAATTAASLMLP